jgi:hypothetical protein
MVINQNCLLVIKLKSNLKKSVNENIYFDLSCLKKETKTENAATKTYLLLPLKSSTFY